MKRRMEEPRQTNISQRWSEAPLQTWIARYNFCFAGDMEYEAKSVIAGGTGTPPRETRLSRPERLVSFHEVSEKTSRSMRIATIYQQHENRLQSVRPENGIVWLCACLLTELRESSRITMNISGHHSPDKAGKFSGYCRHRNVSFLPVPY